jgi:hypothetical protein
MVAIHDLWRRIEMIEFYQLLIIVAISLLSVKHGTELGNASGSGKRRKNKLSGVLSRIDLH